MRKNTLIELLAPDLMLGDIKMVEGLEIFLRTVYNMPYSCQV